MKGIDFSTLATKLRFWSVFPDRRSEMSEQHNATSFPWFLDCHSFFWAFMLDYLRHFPHIANVFQTWSTLALLLGFICPGICAFKNILIE